MTITKKKKKLLRILIPIGAVVIAAGVALAFWLTREEEPQAFLLDVSAYDSVTNSVLKVNNPGAASEGPTPLPRYPASAPEGYEQLRDSADFANRYSTSYQDVYCRENQMVYLSQSYAQDQQKVSLLTYAHFETVQFGGREVFCYTEDQYSGAVWLDGDHLMELLVYGAMERDDLLAWVAGVDSQNPVEPAVRPLEFVPGYRVQVGTYEDGTPRWETQYTSIGGNPAPSNNPTKRVFAQVPEGFESGPTAARLSDEEDLGLAFVDEQGNVLTLKNIEFSESNWILSLDSWWHDPSENWDLTSPVTVNGREGRLYSQEEVSELIWLEEDYVVHLTYQGNATPEQMVAWGEQTMLQTKP